MRETTATKVTTAIIGALVAAALWFAAARRIEREARDASTAAGENMSSLQTGRATYQRDCAFCHGDGAEERATLAWLADDIYRADLSGRRLVDFLLHGRLDDGDDHPPFAHLDDRQLADLVEYLLAYGDTDEAAGGRPRISAASFAARRDGGETPDRR
jgi:mono/diheme cytochrome c family protein